MKYCLKIKSSNKDKRKESLLRTVDNALSHINKNTVLLTLLAALYSTPSAALNSDHIASYFWAAQRSSEAVLIEKISTKAFDVDKIHIINEHFRNSKTRMRFRTFLAVINSLEYESSKLETAKRLSKSVEIPSRKQQCLILKSFSSSVAQQEILQWMEAGKNQLNNDCALKR